MKTKNTIILIAFALTFVTTTFAQKSTIEKDLKMYAEVWDNILNKGQIDLINTTHFDSQVVIILRPENIVGVEGFKGYYQNYLTGFSNIEFSIVKVFGQENNIVKHWIFKGKHTGDFFGIPATNKMVDLAGVTLVEMKNGKIAQEEDFMDNMLFMSQLGVLSDPNNMNVIDDLYQAFATGNMPTVLGLMDENVVWNEAESNSLSDGNPYIGPKAVLNGVFARIGGLYESFAATDVELHEMSNNKVLATLRYKIKAKNEVEEFDVQVAHLWTLTDGKITAFQQYADTKKLANAEE